MWSFVRQLAGTFWLFGAFAVGAFAFTAVRVPETKDRSLEQIGRQLDADVGEDEGADEAAA